MTDALQRLVDGFRGFRTNYFERDRALFERLVREGQSPKVMVVACSDARVDPAILTACQPGDLFVVRNVAAIVPPCQSDRHYHGTSAALEFGVRGLMVEHLVVLGHALCGGLHALAQEDVAGLDGYEFLADWVRIVAPARDAVREELPEATAEVARRALEQSAVILSLRNLMSFPWIRERVENGSLALHGWYFDLTMGELNAYDPAADAFAPVADRPDLPVPLKQLAAAKFDVRRMLGKIRSSGGCG